MNGNVWMELETTIRKPFQQQPSLFINKERNLIKISIIIYSLSLYSLCSFRRPIVSYCFCSGNLRFCSFCWESCSDFRRVEASVNVERNEIYELKSNDISTVSTIGMSSTLCKRRIIKAEHARMLRVFFLLEFPTFYWNQ